MRLNSQSASGGGLWIAAGIAFAVAVAATLAGCSRSQTAAARGDGQPIAVRAYRVEEQVVRRRVEAVGSLYALEESTISSEVEGRVEKVLAEVGDTVKEGQVLVALSLVELQLEVERQRAAAQQVRARLGLGANDPLPRDATQVAFVQRAAADLFDAEQKHRRAEQLHRDQLISQQQLDEAGTRFKGAQAAYDEAVQLVDQLKAQLRSSDAALRLAEKKLNDASIRAPIPGSVKERRVSPGEFLRVQSPVMVIVRTDRVRARLAVPEKWAGALKLGTPVDVKVEAYPAETFRGRLERINPSVSADTRTFEVEALLANPYGKLKPGFFIQASLASEVEEKIRTLPEVAVSYRYGIYKVFRIDSGKVSEREVKTGALLGDRLEILDGLQVGERVAVAVQGELRDGAAIKE